MRLPKTLLLPPLRLRSSPFPRLASPSTPHPTPPPPSPARSPAERKRAGEGISAAMSLRVLNPNAEVLNKSAAMQMNISAGKGLQDVLKTNLGPKGTIKM
jgi:hypothetical protein